LLDDVERLVRARLIPSQLTEDDVHRYPERDFTPRQIGAWCIHRSTHAEKGCTPDVHAALIHTLCDIYSHAVTRSAIGTRINLHFDVENETVKVESTRGEQANVKVTVKQPDNILIRIPAWAPASSLRLTVDGKPQPLRRMGIFAWISADALQSGCEIDLSFDLPTRHTEEKMISGRCYHFTWRGDEIVEIDPQDDPLPFYPLRESGAGLDEQ
jgi:DUF1680 family protein